MYTIQREIGRLDNLRIGLVGDLANGRTVRSLAYLLSMYEGIKFYFVAPDVVRMQVRLLLSTVLTVIFHSQDGLACQCRHETLVAMC